MFYGNNLGATAVEAAQAPAPPSQPTDWNSVIGSSTMLLANTLPLIQNIKFGSKKKKRAAPAPTFIPQPSRSGGAVLGLGVVAALGVGGFFLYKMSLKKKNRRLRKARVGLRRSYRRVFRRRR